MSSDRPEAAAQTRSGYPIDGSDRALIRQTAELAGWTLRRITEFADLFDRNNPDDPIQVISTYEPDPQRHLLPRRLVEGVLVSNIGVHSVVQISDYNNSLDVSTQRQHLLSWFRPPLADQECTCHREPSAKTHETCCGNDGGRDPNCPRHGDGTVAS